MTIPKYFPTLSENGWVENGKIKADYLMAHFLESDFSQTQLYNGHVSSLAYLVQKNMNNIANLVSDVNQTLNSYFERYFTDVYVETKEVEDPSGNNNITGISIFISFKDENGSTQNISETISDINSKFSAAIASNNG